MNISNYETYAQDMLKRPAITERVYLVPGTGHGTTRDLERAQLWAAHRAKVNGGKPVPVLAQDVQMSAWTVVSDHIVADIES